MKKLLLLASLLMIGSQFALAQPPGDDGKWGIKFHGFVNVDYMFDSRQTIAAREGHFLLYPKNEVLDANGNDINAVPNFNILAIRTRLKGIISAPDVLGAKTSGVIEGAFFGQSNGDINGFRLRHAFLKLSWKNTFLLLGQYWHPMFLTEVFPGTVSFNTGAPFEPFSRNPQLRLDHKFSNVHLIFVAASERDFASTGPSGTSSIYLRNSAIPMLDLGLKYKTQNVVLGVGGDFKTLRPRLSTTGSDDKSYEADNTITSTSLYAYGKIVAGEFSIKAQGIYGENNYDLLMLGGYAVKSISDATGSEEYTNVKEMSVWTDLAYGKKVLLGLFFGYTANLGTDDPITGAVYARGSNIDNMFRVSPRVVYSVGKVKLAGELEITSTAYGTADEKLNVTNTNNITNARVLLAVFYVF